MNGNPSKPELTQRLDRLFKKLRENAFDTAIIISKINQYYLTGTLQDGVLILKSDGTAAFFVRKSFERAKAECPLGILHPMNTYRDMLKIIPSDMGNTFMETELVPLIVLERLRKYFKIEKISPLDRLMRELRAVKSGFELGLIEESGRQHEYLLENVVPSLLREGMSEAELLGELYREMLKLGYHGVSRFSMFQTEMVVGQLGFGESSIYPTSFDGPGGMLGMCPAVPIIGSRERRLKKGDLVFADLGYGIYGYHSDKTQVYSYHAEPTDEVKRIHAACMEVQKRAAQKLVPGAIPSEIYNEIMENLPDCLGSHFMGYTDRVKFLGHGVGLQIDESPVIADGFNSPLIENMVIALEPKCGITNVGTVGVEDTYVVKPGGARPLTGGGMEIMVV